MKIKKIIALCLAILLCVAVAGCGGENREPEPSELQTPQYTIPPPPVFELPPEDEIHTADRGVRVIRPEIVELSASAPAAAPVTPETVWENSGVVTWNSFTMPEMAAFDNGSIGVLTIPRIGLTVNVYQAEDQMEAMEHGAAHFKSTSAWDGNIGVSAHNQTPSGLNAFFRDLHLLSVGDTLIYRTALGEREYRVTTIRRISDEDWSFLHRTTDNRLTLITCVNDNLSVRLVVQGVQV